MMDKDVDLMDALDDVWDRIHNIITMVDGKKPKITVRLREIASTIHKIQEEIYDKERDV